MKSFLFALFLLVVAVDAPRALADTETRSGNGSGTIDEVVVDAATTTKVAHWPEGADLEGEHKPLAFDGQWQFTWDANTPDTVAFSGVVTLGNHFTVTNAGSLGGTTKQTFSDYSHSVAGVAQWDAATRTLVFEHKPTERDAGGASQIGQDKAPTCEKISGLFAKTGCSAFLNSSPELEGLQLNLTFGEDLNSFRGTINMIQFSGSRVTKAETVMRASVGGSLK